jgi:hypothetical protein
MQQKTRKLIQVFGLMTSLLVASDVFAGPGGGVIVYAPVAHSIPTLTDLMLVILGLLTAVIAFRVLRAHPGGQPLASLAVLAIAGVTMVPGAKFIEHAYADISPEMSLAGGGNVVIPNNGEYEVVNTSGTDQRIISVTPASTETTAPTCAAGLIVTKTHSCFVNFGNPG